MKSIWAVWTAKGGETSIGGETLRGKDKPESKFRQLTDQIAQNSRGAKFPVSVRLEIDSDEDGTRVWKKIRLNSDGSWS